MSGPWEKYAAPTTASAGPWQKYGAAPQAAPPRRPGDYTPAERAARTQAVMQNARDNPQDPTQGMNGPQQFFAGVGKSLADTWQGAQQLYAAGADFVAPRQNGLSGLVSGQDNSRSAQIQREVDARRKTDSALMNTGAGVAGDVAGQVGQMLIPLADGAKLVSYAGRGAGALRAAATASSQAAQFAALQPVATGESRLGNIGVNAVAGGIGGPLAHGASALAKGAMSRLDPVALALAQKAQAAGIRLGVPQLSDNPLVRTVTNQLGRLPFSGEASRAAARHEGFNAAAGKTIDAPEPRITPQVFADAKSRLSNEFERLTSQNDLTVSPQLQQGLQTAKSTALREGTSDAGKMVAAQVDNLLSKAQNGQINGKAYQAFDSDLGDLIKQGGNPGYHLGKLRDEIRAAMDASITPQDQSAWQAARRKWANLKTLEPLVAKSPDGNISPASLMARTTADKAGKARMAVGNGGALGDLARIGQRFMKEPPNSGTADRLAAMRLVGNLGAAGGLYEAQNHGIISPEAAAWTGVALLGNRAGLSALNSKAAAEGGSRTLSGLARLAKPAPKLLPAAAMALKNR